MSDVDDRLAEIERRLQQLELTGVRPIDPLPPPEVSPPMHVGRNLAFWISLVVIGIVIWEFSNRLAK